VTLDDSKPYITLSYVDYEQKLNVRAVGDQILFLPTPHGPSATLMLLSIFGPHSAVRGILARAVSGGELRADRWPDLRLIGSYGGGGRMLTQMLSKEVTHGVYLTRELLLSHEVGYGGFAVLGEDPAEVYARLVHAYAIPALPEWAPWISDRLMKSGRLEKLEGFNARGRLVRTSETELDGLLSEGVKSGALRF